MNKLSKTAARAALFLALAAGAAQAADVVRIGVATAGGGDPITWGGSPGGVVRANNALEEAFKADGVKVEWLFFKGAGPAVNEALSNKQIDFAYQGDLPQVVGRANGLKTKLLLVSGARNNLYVVTPPASTLARIEDLKNQKVSIFRGTNGHLVAINVLAAHGLAERDIKGVNLDSGSAQAALVSNGVDAAFGGYEWFKVRDQGLAKVIYSTQGQDPAYTRQASLLVREDFERDNPAQVQKVSMSSCRPPNGRPMKATAMRCSRSGKRAACPMPPGRPSSTSRTWPRATRPWSMTSSSPATRPWPPMR